MYLPELPAWTNEGDVAANDYDDEFEEDPDVDDNNELEEVVERQ